MSNKTKIEWCDSTWNPVTGCLHDCEYCYARKIAQRFKGYGGDVEIEKEFRLKYGDAKIRRLVRPLLKDYGTAPYPFGFSPTLHEYRLEDYKNRKGRNIFVCSMADLFGEWVPDEWILQVFKACASAPQHNYLFLTKNPARYVELDGKGLLPRDENMWYGATAASDKSAFCVDGITNKFYSAEPLMSEIDVGAMVFSGAKWVIIGAETGNRKGKVVPKPEWIISIVDDCKKAGIPVFMKDSLIPIIGTENMLREFPDALRRAGEK